MRGEGSCKVRKIEQAIFVAVAHAKGSKKDCLRDALASQSLKAKAKSFGRDLSNLLHIKIRQPDVLEACFASLQKKLLLHMCNETLGICFNVEAADLWFICLNLLAPVLPLHCHNSFFERH